MSNILKYYKSIFTLFLFNSFSWVESGSGAYEALKEANSDFISAKEWNSLKNKYEKKNPEEFKNALKRLIEEDWVKSTLKVSKEIDKLISDWNNQIESTTKKTKSELVSSKKEIKQKNPFYQTLSFKKPRMKWDDVKALQKYLTNNGFDTNWVEWTFWPGTFRALKDFQRKVLWFRKPDGRMDLNWKTMKYILRDMNSKLTTTEKNHQYGKEANDVVNYLNDTDKYITAFNKIYWDKENIISRDNWLFGIVDTLSESDLSKLENELNPDYSKIDKKKLSKVLNLPENSPRFKEGLVRIAVIAAASFILSWGTCLAIELFAVNYGENLKKWPEISKILKALWKWKVDMKKEMKEMYVSKETTISWLNAILDVLNNPNMDTANLKRFMKEVYQPNWFQDTFGIFLPDGYEKVEELIKQFEKTWTTKDAKAAVTEIYKISHKAVIKARKDYQEALSDYKYEKKKYKEKKSDPLFILSSEKQEVEDNYSDAQYWLKRRKKELNKAEQWLARLGEVSSRYTNLDAKRAQIQWEKFNIKQARAEERQIDEEINKRYKPRKLKQINEKLYSKQSYGFGVDINKVSDSKYMEKMLTKMNKETINWETSILAWVIRWVRQHYGINVTIEEFTNAFMNNAKKVDKNEKVYILSNTWRDRLQKFQWNIWNWELFKITVNGQDVYFKDKCTNIVTVVNNMPTTIDYSSSVPIVVWMKTWLNNSDSWSSNWWGVTSRPWEEVTWWNWWTPTTPWVPTWWSSTTTWASWGFGW